MLWIETGTAILSFLGIFLMITEVKFPWFADRIERSIDFSEEVLVVWSRVYINGSFFYRQILFTVFLALLGFVSFPYFFGVFHLLFPTYIVIFQILTYLSVLVSIPVILGLLVVLFGEFLEWLNRMSNGHALGSVGILLECFSFIGDIIQIIIKK